MLAQTLHVAHFQACLLRRFEGGMDRFQFAIGKDVTLREWLASWFALPAAQRDAVIEKDAASPQERIRLLKIQRQHSAADVLKHTDADQLIERPRDFAIILILDAAAILQPSLADTLLGQIDLLPAQRDAQRVDAVLLRGVHHQPSPTAPDVQQTIARQKTQFATEIIQFSLLSAVD